MTPAHPSDHTSPATLPQSLIRQRLADGVKAGMKQRDRAAVAALRSASAAIANAEAVALDDEDYAGVRAGAVQDSPVGVGAAEVARRTLTDAEVVALVAGEATERESAAAAYQRSGHADRAERLLEEARAIRAILADPIG